MFIDPPRVQIHFSGCSQGLDPLSQIEFSETDCMANLRTRFLEFGGFDSRNLKFEGRNSQAHREFPEDN